MWASAPDAFEVLKDKKLLQAYRPKATGIPEKVGAYPINDPDGYYSGFAVSGYGIMWNERYTKANKLPDPKEWQDLAEAIYFDHVSIAPRPAPARRTSPSRRSCRARVGKRADRAPGYGAITSLAHNRQISADIDVADGANGKIVTALTKWVEAEAATVKIVAPSVLFDAVALVVPEECCNDLLKESAATDFLAHAFDFSQYSERLDEDAPPNSNPSAARRA